MSNWHLLAITLAILTLGCVSQPASQPKTESYNTSTLDNLIASFSRTSDEYNIEFTSKNASRVLQLAQDLRYKATEIVRESERLEALAHSKAEKEKMQKTQLLYKSHDKFYNYIYLYLNNVLLKYKDKATFTQKEAEQLISDVKSSLSPLEYCLYYLYKIKTEHLSTWTSKDDELFENRASQYRDINQNLNSLYDIYGGWEYKYTVQVSPNDPLIIEIVNEKTRGMTDQEQIKLTLFNYVRQNVKYTYDPAWETDWVQPPAYTLLYGFGDCEDHAILIASLFARAGIANVYILAVDTTGGNTADHAVVGVSKEGKFEAWDGTYDGEGHAPPEYKTWKIISKMAIEK